ncbi:MAG: hypothetical protein ABI305_06675 [Tepidiformaceae bacterium]
MVQDSGTAAGARGLRRLNQPQPAAVEADALGEPKAMLVRGVFQRVSTIHDSWRIDDEWWRDEIARRYFAVELEGGRHLTVYHDLVTDAWFAQSYDGPKRMEGRGKRSA